MFNNGFSENASPDGFGVLEIVEDGPALFVPLKRTELAGQVTGPLASFQLTQVYGYSRQQCDRPLEAVYRFPLPGNAAVTGVQSLFGAVQVEAALKARSQAESDYKAARREGRQAVLATRESPNVFSLQVTGIQPDQDVRVETSYVELARSEGEGWSLRVPLTTVARYMRSDEVASPHAQGQPLMLMRDPGHRFFLYVHMVGAESVTSPTHTLETIPDRDGTRVRLQDVLPDRDCVLAWQPVQDREGMQILLHNDRDSEEMYFLAMVTPPEGLTPEKGVAREVVLLVDHSASMEGPKWDAADWAVDRFLSDLGEQDAFALGLFHSTTRWFAQGPCRADARTVDQAIRFLAGHKDSGGTELGVALEQALSMGRTDGTRHVLVITDAQVTDDGRILRLADEEVERKDRRRISVLCIDAAPNDYLASELAERGGGICRFLTSAPEAGDITTALDEVLMEWSEPVMTGLRLGVNRDGVQAAGRQIVEGRVDLGDLTRRRPVWVVGRISRNVGEELLFDLTAEGHSATFRMDPVRDAGDYPAIKALFGARQVLGLEQLMHSGWEGEALRERVERLGYDLSEVLLNPEGTRVYAENSSADAREALRGKLAQVALEYGLISSETAFVAERTEAGKRVAGTVPVANALPAGWSGDFLFGQTTTALGSQQILACYHSPMLVDDVDACMDSGDFEAAMTPAPSRFPRAMRQNLIRSFRIQESEPAPVNEAVVFSGIPGFAGQEAVLFDSALGDSLPGRATFSRLVARFPNGKPDFQNPDPGPEVLIFVGDLASPRARVRLADLVLRNGERPLNVRRQSGEPVRIVLSDPTGALAENAPEIEIILVW